MNHSVLIVEDNPEIASLIQLHLKDIHCDGEIVHDGVEGLQRFEQGRHAMVILDLMLPSMGGLEVCKRLRQQNAKTPVIMLTSKASELDRVLGLEIGADDYITKPFSIPELMARVKAQFRRQDAFNPPAAVHVKKLQFNALIIEPEKHYVELDGKVINLTAKEFDLLLYFANHPGRVYSRIELLDQVWGYSFEGYEHTVNSHINRLRAKIESNPAKPSYIMTVWGVGYKFNEWARSH